MHFTSWFNMFIQTRRNSAICTLLHQLQASWVRQNKDWLNGCSNFASSTACNRCWTRFAKEHWCYWFNCWLVWFLCRKELCRLHRRLLLGQTCNGELCRLATFIHYNKKQLYSNTLQISAAILCNSQSIDTLWPSMNWPGDLRLRRRLWRLRRCLGGRLLFTTAAAHGYDAATMA